MGSRWRRKIDDWETLRGLLKRHYLLTLKEPVIGYWQNIQNIHINEFLIFFYFNVEKKEISRFSKFSSMGFSIWYANILVWTLRSIVWSLTVNSMKSSLLFRSKIKQKKKFSVKIILKIKLLGIPNLLFIKAVQKRGLQIRTGTNIKIHSQKTLWRRRNPNGKARDPDRYKRWPTVLTVKPENQTGIKGYKPSK